MRNPHHSTSQRPPAAEDVPAGPSKDIVVFMIRRDTPYDELLMRHGDRQLARAAVGSEVERLLARWQTS